VIGRPGRVYVEVHDDHIRVGGRATLVSEQEINV